MIAAFRAIPGAGFITFALFAYCGGAARFELGQTLMTGAADTTDTCLLTPGDGVIFL